MRTASRLAGYATGVLLLLSATAGAAAPHTFEYLSVEANEGGSSGGHAAVRFDDVIYHFQHHAPGVLRLHREDANGFLFTYNLLQNRGIAVSRIAVSDETYELLRDWFNRRYLTEGMEFDALDMLSDNRQLIGEFLQRAHASNAIVDQETSAGIALRGTGYFFPDGNGVGAAAESVPLIRLRDRVQRRYGADFLQQRVDAARTALTQLNPADESFSRQYTDLMIGVFAVVALQRALPLQSTSFEAPANDEFRLRADDRAALAAFAERLEESLLALLQSPRPDWGFPLLVGMARLVAVHRSVEAGRLVFLDAFGVGAHIIPPAAWRGREAMMVDLLEEARDELERARRRFAASAAPGEADFARLESACNRFNELARGLAEQREVRVQSGLLVPSRAARRTDFLLPLRSAAALEEDLTVARKRERATGQQLQQRYAYNLITRNCVSEIFRGLNSAMAEAVDTDPARRSLHDISANRLGGYIEPGQSLTFIPFVSTLAVRAAYNVTDTQQVPSYRSRRVTQMYGRENPALVYLRESNTLTSTVYTPSWRDSFFLFFTDAVPTRPLFGSVNLVAGLGASAVGLATLPFDGGATFLAGMKGALFSLPELAFVSLRKGTYDYIERPYRPVRAAALPMG